MIESQICTGSSEELPLKSSLSSNKRFRKNKANNEDRSDRTVGYRSCPSNPEALLPIPDPLPDHLELTRMESTPSEILSNQEPQTREIKLYVKTQIPLGFGRAVYLIGGCRELGGWRVDRALRLQWIEGDFWRGYRAIATAEDLEYKYVIANFAAPEAGEVQWEEGINRRISLAETLEDDIYLNQKWNHEKITLKVREAEAEEVALVGNAVDLGVYSSRRVMRLEPSSNGQKVWSTTFYLEKAKDYLRYFYVRTVNGQSVREKEPGRYLFMTSIMDSPNNLAGREVICRKPGEIIVVDLSDMDSFKVTEITDEIVVGPYVNCEKDIDDLAKRGVKSVLSLQSKDDMNRYKIDWKVLCHKYRTKGIEPFNIQVMDMKARDFLVKSPLALCVLERLVKNYGKTYVHCTAGIYRSPQLITLFLIQDRGFTIQEAVQLFRQKRPFAKPIPALINMCLVHVQSQTEGVRRRTSTMG